ncbi:MAG: outer membrane protein assembly factor BamA [Gammaproteobacteria bacterium]|jgi:outer membrane protein insertion porin family|nr:outer membrane protein assembly factor BamA [Gammaproteobacteria bacterium]MBT3869452.1 outer membrane protein assembly factor BamA [Gammaproteobacteria bacterium]MBT4616720.1 outer membrane protein assembly factor BamA [Gammaproteobacteria bacterium]MBT5196790.1 outer membrane protein assembly factor BamA [Gammaproteobacteria bacterium]MBT5444262.1 outer membrane protein assembly factor BamA [Gammaproteobacteria bacterium]
MFVVKLKDSLGKYARSLILLVTLFYCTSSFGFVISDIRVEGLQRVSAGTVFGAVPYSVGDNVGAEEIRTIARSLFQTETFDDVQIGRDGNVLVIVVKERPTIDSIEFEGNKAIKTEALIEGLQGSGLSEGQIFKKVTLDQIASDLERQYVSQGRYDANIETTIENLPRNRVAIKVDVYEGNVSGISHINIVGNTVFDDETLIELLELKLPGWLSFYTKDDQYSREKLQSDIEVLESHYLDRGYLNFRVDSTQVSIAPNMEDVYITVNVIEGDQFKISAVEVAGELRDIPEENIRAMLLTREGQTFSRQYMTFSEERIESALGNAGYTFASATGEPAANDDGETVTVKYFIDAGKRAYVRRLNFQGNTVTQDHVLRREMRQMEGGWASTAMIEGSKIRLQRLGFFKDVSVETPAVPGTDDQIDVNYTVEEQPSGSISATVGYAQRMGLILGLGYQESNVFGTGNSINIGVNRSDYQQALNVSFFDPYYTVDGVSRGYAAFFRKSDYEERNIASFSTDSYGLNVSFGYPISEISRIGLTVGIERTEIKEGVIPAQEISEFLDEEGNEFDLVSLTASYSMSALNRGMLPSGGRSQSMSFEMTVPGSELEYYRLNYTGQVFYPLFNPFVLRLRANLGYGEAYGGTENFPFYKHFFGGGMGSVRGYESNSLGPRSTPSPQDQFNDPDPIGGNVLVELSAEVLFPLPFIEDQSQLKSVLFFDAGNVFNTNCPDVSVYCLDLDEGELRYSAGIAVTWITGFAPISFALAFPLNDKQGDESESFQFELGKTF